MEAAALPLLTRVPRVDSGEYDFIILHVSSTGDQPFDLKLVGTENAQAYSLRIKHRKISEYQAKNFSGTEQQWEEALSVAILGVAAVQTEFTHGVEAVAKVDGKTDTITIIIQKKIEGITQKLGAITLSATEKDEPDLFEWCGLTVLANHNTIQEIMNLKEQLRAKDKESQRLTSALEELVRVKNAHEDDLAQKFSILLNEKKLKIRDQQRLLQASHVDAARLEEVEQNRIPARSSSPGPSSTRKRNAAAVRQDDDSEDGFEMMDVDAADQDHESNIEGRQTEDEQSTADEDSEDEVPPAHNKPKASGSGKQEEIGFALPPTRALPFSKKPPPVSKPVPPVEGSETESDDDEL